MREKGGHQKENIILFPGLVTKLVEKGMKALKEKAFQDSLQYFEETLQLEPDHPQARLGAVLCFIELNQLEDAVQASEEMLKADIGDYYDVLQIHISLLVQLGKYGEVVAILEAVLAEDKVPAHYAESFYQLLHFSRNMIEDAPIIEADDSHLLEIEELINKLKAVDPSIHWQAIQQLRKYHSEEINESLMEFVEKKENDMLLKTFVLEILKEKKVNQSVKIEKIGKSLEVNLNTLIEPNQSSIGNQVEAVLSSQLEHIDPTMLELAKEIWWQYVLAIFPFEPEPMDCSLWAASVHVAVLDNSGMDFDEREIAHTYKVEVKQMLHIASELLSVLEEVFQTTER